MFLLAAKVLASMVSEHDLAIGRIYPSLRSIREVSRRIAVAVAGNAYDRGLARAPRPDDLRAAVERLVFDPHEYTPYV